MSLLFDLPATPAIPVRIFCVGGNDAAHARDPGNAVDRLVTVSDELECASDRLQPVRLKIGPAE